MSGQDRRSYVYYPTSLNELLQLYKRKPRATLFAGGTFLLLGQPGRVITLPREVICLKYVEELEKISRSDRYVEIGAGASINQVLRVGGKVLPPVFRRALEMLSPPGIASLATVGGNICVSQYALSCIVLSHLLDARIELRHQGGSRWVPPGRFRGPNGALGFRPGEMVTRIRVPTEGWNVHRFQKFGKLYHPRTEPLVFAAVAQTARGTLDDLRIVLSAHTPAVVRGKELEAELVGRRLPLPQREIEGYLKGIDAQFKDLRIDLSGLQRHRAFGLIRSFLSSLTGAST